MIFVFWGLAGAEAVVAVGQVMVLGFHQDANQNIKLNENQKYAKLMHEVSVMCSWHLCSDK